MVQRSAENGRLQVPHQWPKWKFKCTARRGNGKPCTQWAITGMPTCRFHGSGGEKNRQIGQLRYLCWIIVGGAQDNHIPVEAYCRVALAAAFQVLIVQGKGTVDQQLKAALWLTDSLTQ